MGRKKTGCQHSLDVKKHQIVNGQRQAGTLSASVMSRALRVAVRNAHNIRLTDTSLRSEWPVQSMKFSSHVGAAAILVLLGLLFSGQAQAETVSEQLRNLMGAAPDHLSASLETMCRPQGIRRSPAGTYPIAGFKSEIVSCQPSEEDSLETLAVLVSDDQVVAIELTTRTETDFQTFLSPTAGMAYAGFRIVPEIALIGDTAQNRIFITAPETLHSHVFLNSLSDWQPGSVPDLATQFRPFQLGAGETGFRQSVKTLCDYQDWKPQDPKRWGWSHERIVQLDCFGPKIAGAKRKVELIFADGELKHAWVLLAPQELRRVSDLLEGKFGPPVAISPSMDRYGSSKVFLRSDKPEILIADFATAKVLAGE